MTEPTPNWTCPTTTAPSRDQFITLAHGEGGRLSRRLIQEQIASTIGNDLLNRWDDAARLPTMTGQPVFTTDSFVVSPLFFPGGDIGRLAVFGTVNDLIVSGARPRWLSLSLILEEGFPTTTLRRVMNSIADAARETDVRIVAGDTKVVPRGAADQLFINTSGIGELIEPSPPGTAALEVGDELLVTGPVGQHGVAILSCRENLGFEPPPCSDCGSLWEAADALRAAKIPIRAMRDATRGGVGAVLHEWAAACGHTPTIHAEAIPISPEARGACELLGLDPLFLANEGLMVVAVPRGTAAAAVTALQRLARYCTAARIGEFQPRRVSSVLIRRGLGREQPLDEPIGGSLPRIC